MTTTQVLFLKAIDVRIDSVLDCTQSWIINPENLEGMIWLLLDLREEILALPSVRSFREAYRISLVVRGFRGPEPLWTQAGEDVAKVREVLESIVRSFRSSGDEAVRDIQARDRPKHDQS